MNTEDRFKFRIWDDTHKRYLPSSDAIIDGRTGKKYHGPIFSAEYIIEQCTGVKDKSGKLIFEGDILKVPAFPTGSVNMRVCWSDSPCHWDLKYTGRRAELEDMIVLVLELGNASEIVGNIHEMESEVEDE